MKNSGMEKWMVCMVIGGRKMFVGGKIVKFIVSLGFFSCKS